MTITNIRTIICRWKEEKMIEPIGNGIWRKLV